MKQAGFWPAIVCFTAAALLAVPVYGHEIIGWGAQKTPNTPLTNITKLAAGGDHSLALKSDGTLVGWGCNRAGQATPPAGNDYVAIAAGDVHSLALKSDGTLVGWGDNNWGRATPPAGNDYIAIAAGNTHALALKNDGSIVGWGEGVFGPGAPPSGNDYVAIAAGYDYSLALKSDGTLVGWGWTWVGGTPPAGNDYIAVSSGFDHALALTSDGRIVGWGSNDYGAATSPSGMDYVAISAGHDYSLALKETSPTLSELLDDLAQQVAGLNLHKGIANSLNAKLESAIHVPADTHEHSDAAAILALEGFINEVQAQQGKKIAEQDANDLIQAAQQIIEMLSSEEN